LERRAKTIDSEQTSKMVKSLQSYQEAQRQMVVKKDDLRQSDCKVLCQVKSGRFRIQQPRKIDSFKGDLSPFSLDRVK
jgi:hypothetical protein